MDTAEFEKIAGEEWDKVPEHFGKQIDNVVLLVEDEPSAELRAQEKLEEHDTLLGFYHGIPNTERGELYGVGATLPDTITLFRLPLLEEAEYLEEEDREKNGTSEKQPVDYIRRAVRETLWHELGHYFGLDDDHLHEREHEGTNKF